MAAAFTGVQRSQPTFATAPALPGCSAWAAAGLSATALARVPPNQAASPRSCRERDTVLRATGCSFRSGAAEVPEPDFGKDRKSTRLNSSHANISYAVFCLKKKKKQKNKFTFIFTSVMSY